MVDLWLYVRVAAMQPSRMMTESATVFFIYQTDAEKNIYIDASLMEMIGECHEQWS